MGARQNYSLDLFFPGDKPPLFEVDLLGDKLKHLIKQFKINLFPRHSLVAVGEARYVFFLISLFVQ